MKNYLFVILLFFSTIASAIPAKRVKQTITLPDGSKREVVLRGDESFHYLQDASGNCFLGDSDMGYRLSSEDEVRSIWKSRSLQRSQIRRSVRRSVSAQNDSETNPSTPIRKVVGKKRGLVILVNFSDRKLTYTQSEFENYFNKAGYSNFGMSGSVHDYFLDNSYGMFDLSFDVVGPVTVSKQMSFYGSNDSHGNDKYAATMICEAVRLADAKGVNYKDYDWDNDGYVDQVYVIYAGFGEAAGAPASTIWPHEYELGAANYYGDGEGVIRLDGVNINTYACSNELLGNSGTSIDGIGTACHEFSHCLGIPDMYDTNDINFGMDAWDLMDYGSYNDNGCTPAGYTSYERWYCGWLEPIELSDGCDVDNMPSLHSSPTAYVIYNQKNRNEYYLLENRQNKGWFKADAGHGLLIIHVDYDKKAWADNTVNNLSNHQRMTIIPADNNCSTLSLKGDTWPGTTKNTALTNSSVPAAKLYNANSDGTKFMNAPIEYIAENMFKGTISFTFNGGNPLPAPTDLLVKNVSKDGFTLSWTAVPEANSYELQLIESGGSSEESQATLLLSEDFSGFNKGSDGTSDLKDNLNNYTKVPGWAGEKVYYTAKDEAKLGTGTVAGYLTTPVITTSTGWAVVEFTLRPYNTDKPSFQLRINDEQMQAETVEEETTYTYVLQDYKDPFRITISAAMSSKCRMRISDLKVYEVPSGSKFHTGKVERNQVLAMQKVNSVKTYKTSSTEYTFTGLNADCDYTCCVRAITADGKAGVWSEHVPVDLQSGNDGSVDAIRDILTKHPFGDGVMYNLNGTAIKNRQSSTGHGIYIRNGVKYVTR